jgi:MFS transporter, NNP family, nitrate/nitrite transporter
LSFGVDKFLGWRLAMVVPGVALFFMGIAYWFCTQDAPDGNYKELRERGELENGKGKGMESFMLAIKDYRVWALFIIYAACFGVELTINNVAALYYHDQFHLDVKTAGLIAGLFGLMNIFARSMGGIFSDLFAKKMGLKGRVLFLFIVLLGEGLALMLFSQMAVLAIAVGTMIVFSLFVQMSEGATYGIVPFINKKALGAVAGIVGAGGNAGAVAAGFLFKSENFSTQQALMYLGIMVAVAAFFSILVKFSPETQKAEDEAFEKAMAEKEAAKGALA